MRSNGPALSSRVCVLHSASTRRPAETSGRSSATIPSSGVLLSPAQMYYDHLQTKAIPRNQSIGLRLIK